MFDHVSLTVSDLPRSRRFYTQSLAPLGHSVQHDVTAEQTGAGAATGFGSDGKAAFWIAEGRPSAPTHLAFAAKTRADVQAFYDAAIAAGGKDHGPPGRRPHDGPTYSGGFVIDPDGHNVEAVCRIGAA